MSYSVLNNSIAGVSKNGIVIGAFKLAHIYQGEISQVVWRNEKGTAVAERDELGNVVKKEVPGFSFHYQYKNTSGKWSGVVMVDDETGETMTKGCIRVDIALPKALTKQSKLSQLMILLGLAKTDEIQSEITEDLLIADEDEETFMGMSLNDLVSDTDEIDLSIEELVLEDIYNDLLPFINRIFTAPFTLSDRGYPIIEKDFTKWQIIAQKVKSSK